jgi:hypothetical protein
MVRLIVNKVQRINLLSTLGEKDVDVDLLILDTLELLGALNERNSKNVTSSRGLAQEIGSIRVPSDGERGLPTAEQRVSELELKQSLSLVGSESGRRNVANNIDIVGVHTSYLERNSHVGERMAGAIALDQILCEVSSAEGAG